MKRNYRVPVYAEINGIAADFETDEPCSCGGNLTLDFPSQEAADKFQANAGDPAILLLCGVILSVRRKIEK